MYKNVCIILLYSILEVIIDRLKQIFATFQCLRNPELCSFVPQCTFENNYLHSKSYYNALFEFVMAL